MYCREHVRMVRRWDDPQHATGEIADRPAGQDALPWMRGLPMPAWTEARTAR